MYPNDKSVLINLGAVSGCFVLLLLLRFGVGPVLGPVGRSVFSLVLIFFAICCWETLEGVIALIVRDDLAKEMGVYGSMLAMGVVAAGLYEWCSGYDLVGNHLLL